MGYLSFMLLERVLLLIQAKDLSYNFFLLFIKALFLAFNRLLLALSRDVFRLFIRQPIAGYLLSIIFGIVTK
jgi:hypothetical protein